MASFDIWLKMRHFCVMNRIGNTVDIINKFSISNLFAPLTPRSHLNSAQHEGCARFKCERFRVYKKIYYRRSSLSHVRKRRKKNDDDSGSLQAISFWLLSSNEWFDDARILRKSKTNLCVFHVMEILCHISKKRGKIAGVVWRGPCGIRPASGHIFLQWEERERTRA